MRTNWHLLLIGLIITVDILLTKGTEISDITNTNIEDAFRNAEGYVTSIQQNEGNFPELLIPRGTVSPETRHYGQGGNRRSLDIHANQYIFEQATLNLKFRFNFNDSQVWTDFPKVVLWDRSARATTAVDSCKRFFMRWCDDNGPFRTVDGGCNNLRNPNWGMATTCLERMLPPSYRDGVSYPRTSVNGYDLPNPRNLSVTIHSGLNMDSKFITLMVMQFGQFLDHDLSLTPMIRTHVNMSMINCCEPQMLWQGYCMEIDIPNDDAFYKNLNRTCMNFVRSSTCNSNCSLGPRNHINMLTHFIDGSNVYGSTLNAAQSLRTFYDGRLRVNRLNNVEDILPELSYNEKNQCTYGSSPSLCFLAGDERVNEQPGLTSLHTVWLRQHNRIAQQLKILHNDWSDEKLYQTARRIVGAQMQHITYGEFLPVIMGGFMDVYSLYSESVGRTIYNPELNPSIMTEFSAAAFRFGHPLIQNLIPETGRFAQDLKLRDNYFNSQAMLSGQMGSMMSGMCSKPAKQFDPHIVDGVTNHLFEVSGTSSGLDLVAINIQRGRDHGLQPYVNYVLDCLRITITSFDDLVERNLMTHENANKLRENYADVRDVDLFTGGVSEIPKKGAVFGPTFACIIGRQFNRLRFGDRFYYEHDGNNGVRIFTDDQLKEIRKTSLAEVICSNSGIQTIKKNVFLASSPFVACNQLPNPDVKTF